MAEKRDVQRNFRLTAAENQALKTEAERKGIPETKVIALYLQRLAARHKA
jgi:hypothetical protein